MSHLVFLAFYLRLVCFRLIWGLAPNPPPFIIVIIIIIITSPSGLLMGGNWPSVCPSPRLHEDKVLRPVRCGLFVVLALCSAAPWGGSYLLSSPASDAARSSSLPR